MLFILTSITAIMIYQCIAEPAQRRRKEQLLSNEVDSWILDIANCQNLKQVIDLEETLPYFKLLFGSIFGYDEALKLIKHELNERKIAISNNNNIKVI